MDDRREGLWKPGRRKPARIHPRRPRRPCRGERVQIDGSPHDWFEDRGPRCTLIVFIDDATGALLVRRFAPAETTQADMETLRGYLAQHGRPVALYSDKHSIFRVNHPDREGALTPFTRALRTLDIEPIHANTPQAKGRVERANQTLQDRLVKELRLAGISNIDAANAFLPDFVRDYNQRFAAAPQNPTDAHRPVLHDAQALDLIFSLHAHRKLSKNLTVQYKNREYQLTGQGKGYRLRGAQVTLCEAFDGTVTLLYKGQALSHRILAEGEPPIPLDDEKSIHASVDRARALQLNRPAHKPAPDHPWRRAVTLHRHLPPETPKGTFQNWVDNLVQLQARCPFPVRAIQIDGGSEFKGAFEEACQAAGIALYVLPPKRPQRNGGGGAGQRHLALRVLRR